MNFSKRWTRIGLPDEIVRLQPYTAAWAWAFGIEKLRLWLSLYGRAADIQHVGSTAIPGMVAKPIIDICVAVADYRRAMEYVQPIEQVGYQYKGESDRWPQHLFVKGPPTTHRLYVVEVDSVTWLRKERIRFSSSDVRPCSSTHQRSE